MEKTLAQTNPNLIDPKRLYELIARNALELCAFEGARDLVIPQEKEEGLASRKARSKKSVK